MALPPLVGKEVGGEAAGAGEDELWLETGGAVAVGDEEVGVPAAEDPGARSGSR